jgi:plastocyanin
MHARTAAKPLALLFAVLMVGGLAACGDDSGSAATKGDSSSTTAKSDDDATSLAGSDAGNDADVGTEVTIVAKDFSLTSVTAKPGQEVYLDNQGSQTHTVTADEGAAFDTGRVAPGKEADFDAPSQPGTYTFHCSIHASMTGTLTVEA